MLHATQRLVFDIEGYIECKQYNHIVDSVDEYPIFTRRYEAFIVTDVKASSP